MTAPTLQVTDRRASVQVRGGMALTVTPRPTTLQVTQAGQVLELPIRRSTIELRAGLVLEVPIRRTVLEFQSPGVQGPPGPAQIYDQAGVPAAIPGYVLLLFQPAGTSDPNDRLMSLIE